MNLFVFSTHSFLNVVHAFGHKRWAVTTGKTDSVFKKIKTDSQVLEPGDLVFFWITQQCEFRPSVLTMPCVVASKADTELVLENDPWPGVWHCPFRIRPIGSYERFLRKDDCYELSVTQGESRGNLSRDLHLYTAFVPVPLARCDVSYLLDALVFEDFTVGEKRRLLASVPTVLPRLKVS